MINKNIVSNPLIFNKIITIFIVLSPMFLQYSIFVPFLLFPEFFLLLLLFLSFFKSNNIDVKLLIFVLIFIIYAVFISFLQYLIDDYVSLELTLTTSFRLLFYFIILLFLSGYYFVRDFGAKLIVFVASFNSVYGIAQFLAFKFLGFTLPWYLPFLTVQHGQRLISEQDDIFDTFGFRFSGLFSEPAHFSQYVGFAFLILLFFDNGQLFSKANKFLLSILFLISLLLSASGTGFFILSFVLLMFFYNLIFINFSLRKFLVGIVIFIISFIILSLLIYSNDTLSIGFQRILNFSDTSSLYVRIIRPLDVFLNLDIWNVLFGVGYGNYSNYLFYFGLENDYESNVGIAWSNSLGVFLVGSGLLGTTIVILIYRYLFVKTDCFGKYSLLFVFVHLFFSDLPHTLFFVCFLSFLYYEKTNVYNVNFNFRT